MGHKPLVLGECTFVYGKYRANWLTEECVVVILRKINQYGF
jgi:hypothetical protein